MSVTFRNENNKIRTRFFRAFDDYIIENILKYLGQGLTSEEVKVKVKTLITREGINGKVGRGEKNILYNEEVFKKPYNDLWIPNIYCNEIMFDVLTSSNINMSAGFVIDEFEQKRIDIALAYIDIVLTNHIIIAMIQRGGIDFATRNIYAYIYGGRDNEDIYHGPGFKMFITSSFNARSCAKLITPFEFERVIRGFGIITSSITEETIKNYISNCHVNALNRRLNFQISDRDTRGKK